MQSNPFSMPATSACESVRPPCLLNSDPLGGKKREFCSRFWGFQGAKPLAQTIALLATHKYLMHKETWIENHCSTRFFVEQLSAVSSALGFMVLRAPRKRSGILWSRAL